MHWYVVRTKPGREEDVLSRFADRGLETFLPKTAVRRRRRMRSIEPLFPAYVFVRTDLGAAVWTTIRWTPGVKSILACDGVPSPVPDGAIALIRDSIGASGIVEPNALFVAGDHVRITEGSFAGLVGVLQDVPSPSGRVRVLLEMLRGASIELDGADLELAS